MRPIAPRLPVGEEVTYAEEQEEYMPITVARVLFSDGARGIVTRYTFTPDERARIAAGEDVYFTQLGAPNSPMTPQQACVGAPAWARA